MRSADGVIGLGIDNAMTGTRAGGWLTGMADVADDDTLGVRNDINNLHIRGPSDKEWIRFFRPGDNFIEAEKITVGCWDIAICPTNSDKIWVGSNGYSFITNNRTATIAKEISFTRDTTLTHQNDQRMFGTRMLFDPANPNVRAQVTNNGIKWTLNDGESWQVNETFGTPTAGAGYGCIAVNRASSTSTLNGVLQTTEWVIFLPGLGVFRSTGGIAGTFGAISSQPANATKFTDVRFDRSGKLHCCGDYTVGDGPYHTWTAGGGWNTPLNADDEPFNGVTTAISPNDTNKVIVFAGTGPGFFSADGGASFLSYAEGDGDTNLRVPGEVGWHEWTAHNSLSMGNGPQWLNLRDVIAYGDGIGTWEMTADFTKPINITRKSTSLGIDQLITQALIWLPNGKDEFVAAHQDRPAFRMPAATIEFPAVKHGMNNVSSLMHAGHGIDFACDDPDYVVVPWSPGNAPVFDWPPQRYLGYSESTGGPWKPFPTGPDVSGGIVVVGNKGVMLWAPGNRDEAYWTTDGAITEMNPFTIGGYAIDNQIYDKYSSRLPMLADKQVPNRFYWYIHGGEVDDARSQAIRGIWQIDLVPGGVPILMRKRSTYVHGLYPDIYQGRLKMPPGKSPHLFWNSGPLGSDSWPNAVGTDVQFSFSPDGGVNFGLMPNLLQVTDFAFGKPSPSAPYPAIYASGYATTDLISYGRFAMFDFDWSQAGDGTVTTTGTWRLIDNYPLNLSLIYTSIAASMDTFGLSVWGTACGQVETVITDRALAT